VTNLRGVLLALASVAVLVAVTAVAPPRTERIYADSVGPGYALDDLLAEADLVALVRPTGTQVERWNGDGGRRWTADADSPARPLIYRDEEVQVVEALRGAAPAMLTIRNLGGIDDGVEFNFNGLHDLEDGATYLVFLQSVETPLEHGTERALSFVGQGHGLFSSDGSVFVNSYGLSVAFSDIPSR